MEPPPPPPEPGSDSTSTASDSAEHSSRSRTNSLRDAVSRAWECGAEDARRTARESIPKARQAASEFAADLAYGLGYGASFAATLFDSLGARDAGYSSERGMEAGRSAAQEVIRRLRHRRSSPPPARPNEGPAVP